MLRIIVVDDEFYARKALVKILNRLEQEIDLAVLGDLETGKDAIAFLQGQPVDVVITDIRMPEMDGLQLANYIRQYQPETDVIIETGYADFQYAREALQYGVKDYITKPIDREELREALVNVAAVRKRREQEVEGKIQQSLEALSLERLSIQEICGSPALQARLMGDSLGCFSMPYQLLLLQLEGVQDLDAKNRVKSRFFQEIQAREKAVFYFSENREYVLLCFGEGTEKDSFRRKGQAGRFLQWCRGNGLGEGCIGVSRSHQGVEALYNGYKEAVYAMNQRLLQGWGKVYFYTTEASPTPLAREGEEALHRALGEKNAEEAGEVIHGVLSDPRLLETGDIYALYHRIISVLGILNRYYLPGLGESSESKDRMLLLFSRRYDLYNFRRMEELEAYLLGITREICCQTPEGGNRSIIHEMMDYIARSYQYDISLTDLAEKKYFMNASYLSRLFKSTVGKTFSKYLIEFRLEKSKELLGETILKVSDIATHVGYNDVSHFIQSFRKHYGVTPEEYRGAHLREEPTP